MSADMNCTKTFTVSAYQQAEFLCIGSKKIAAQLVSEQVDLKRTNETKTKVYGTDQLFHIDTNRSL